MFLLLLLHQINFGFDSIKWCEMKCPTFIHSTVLAVVLLFSAYVKYYSFALQCKKYRESQQESYVNVSKMKKKRERISWAAIFEHLKWLIHSNHSLSLLHDELKCMHVLKHVFNASDSFFLIILLSMWEWRIYSGWPKLNNPPTWQMKASIVFAQTNTKKNGKTN